MTSAQTKIDQELAQFGWMESIATNSISDFKSPKENVAELSKDENKSDLVDMFICHLIFYVFFCYSIFLHLFIDLGFASFIEKKVNKLLQPKNQNEITNFIRNFTIRAK